MVYTCFASNEKSPAVDGLHGLLTSTDFWSVIFDPIFFISYSGSVVFDQWSLIRYFLLSFWSISLSSDDSWLSWFSIFRVFFEMFYGGGSSKSTPSSSPKLNKRTFIKSPSSPSFSSGLKKKLSFERLKKRSQSFKSVDEELPTRAGITEVRMMIVGPISVRSVRPISARNIGTISVGSVRELVSKPRVSGECSCCSTLPATCCFIRSFSVFLLARFPMSEFLRLISPVLAPFLMDPRQFEQSSHARMALISIFCRKACNSWG